MYRKSNIDAEKLDYTPIEIPLGRDRPQSFKDELMEQVRAIVQAEKNQEFETPEEFWDLDIEEDKDPFESKYELLDMDEEYFDPGLEEAAAQAAPGQAETQPADGEIEPPEAGVSINPDT